VNLRSVVPTALGFPPCRRRSLMHAHHLWLGQGLPR
jgi:hypothetical protein